MTTTQLAVVLVVTALLGVCAVVAGTAVLWGVGWSLITAGALLLTSVAAVVLYDGDKT